MIVLYCPKVLHPWPSSRPIGSSAQQRSPDEQRLPEKQIRRDFLLLRNIIVPSYFLVNDNETYSNNQSMIPSIRYNNSNYKHFYLNVFYIQNYSELVWAGK